MPCPWKPEWFPAKNRSTCCSLQLNTSVIKPGLPAKGVWYPLEPFLIMYVSTICCQSFFLEPMITTLREEKIMDCSLQDRKSNRLTSSHTCASHMPSSA